MGVKDFRLSDVMGGVVSNLTRLPDIQAGGPNSLGWEDSAEITNDGTKLSFVYLPFDILAQFGQGKTIFTGEQHPERPGIYNVLWSKIFTKTIFNNAFLPGVGQPIPTEQYQLPGCQHIQSNLLAYNMEDFAAHTRNLYVKVNGKTYTITGLESYKPDNPNFTPFSPGQTMSAMFFDGLEPGAVKRNIFLSLLDGDFKRTSLISLGHLKINTDVEEAQPYYYPQGNLLYFSRNYNELLECNLSTGVVRSVLKLRNMDKVVAIGEPSRDKLGNFYFVAVFKVGDHLDADICWGKI